MARNHWKALAFLSVPLMVSLQTSISWSQPPHESPETMQQAPVLHGDLEKQASPLQHQDSKSRDGMGDRHERLIQELGLTSAQAQAVRSIAQAGRQESQALYQQLRTKRRALAEYLKRSDALETSATAMNTEINAVQKRLSELRLRTWFAIRAHLTPEQLQKLQTLPSPFDKHSMPPRKASSHSPGFGDGHVGDALFPIPGLYADSGSPHFIPFDPSKVTVF